MNWNGLVERAASDRMLARYGAGTTFRVLLRCGAQQRLMSVHEGRIAAFDEGPFVMPCCDFSLSGGVDAWSRFAAAEPAPGDQDLFAFLRRGEISLEGDTRKFYAHLLWLKLCLLNLRGGRP
jgi:hypothetical protein